MKIIARDILKLLQGEESKVLTPEQYDTLDEGARVEMDMLLWRTYEALFEVTSDKHFQELKSKYENVAESEKATRPSIKTLLKLAQDTAEKELIAQITSDSPHRHDGLDEVREKIRGLISTPTSSAPQSDSITGADTAGDLFNPAPVTDPSTPPVTVHVDEENKTPTAQPVDSQGGALPVGVGESETPS